jgi:hypothetical protein
MVRVATRIAARVVEVLAQRAGIVAGVGAVVGALVDVGHVKLDFTGSDVANAVGCSKLNGHDIVVDVVCRCIARTAFCEDRPRSE